jgi:hypothetical protein
MHLKYTIMSTTTDPSSYTITPQSGSLFGGQTITITGPNLGNAYAVNFISPAETSIGGTNFKQLPDNSISVINPPVSAQGSYTVSVEITGVDSITVGNFNYNSPVVSSIVPSTGSLSGGNKITINGQYFTGASAVNFGLAGASDFVIVLDTQITATSPNNSSNGAIVDVYIFVEAQSSLQTPVDQFTYSSSSPSPTPIYFSQRMGTFMISFGTPNYPQIDPAIYVSDGETVTFIIPSNWDISAIAQAFTASQVFSSVTSNAPEIVAVISLTSTTTTINLPFPNANEEIQGPGGSAQIRVNVC